MGTLLDKVVRLSLLPFLVVTVLSVTGCGDASQPADVADQDELAAYLAEHGDDTDLDAGDDE